jgi:hypothetical protein
MSQTFPVLTRKATAAHHVAALGVTGLLTEPSLGISSNSDRACARSSIGRSPVATSACQRDRNRGELLLAPRQDPSRGPSQAGTVATPTRANGHSKGSGSNGRDHPPASDQEPLFPPLGPWSRSRAIAQCFLRLSNLDPTLLGRVGSYEARLWRQAAQTIWTLEAMRQPPPPIRQRLRHRVAPFTWDRQR